MPFYLTCLQVTLHILISGMEDVVQTILTGLILIQIIATCFINSVIIYVRVVTLATKHTSLFPNFGISL